VVAIDEVSRDEQRIFGAGKSSVGGIDMNETAQLELLARFEALYPSVDFPAAPAPSHRYHYENPAYSYSDAIMLHCMLRHFRPRRIIEVGSGYSSCAILDTRERHLGGNLEVTFVEPYPALLQSLLRPADRDAIEIIPKRVQDVPVETFARLEEGDFLFIDSTHVSKTGSDVNYLVFDVLPALNRGVHVHFHDVFYPFEYPKEWVMGGRSWNEQYVLRAFLQYNAAFSLTMMNTYLQRFHPERFAAGMPLCLRNTGGSLWIEKN
jgi:predicted O-methyltransferase YrrM